MVPLNQREVPQGLRRRLAVAFALVLVGFGVLLGRLWFLQVLHGEEMLAKAKSNRIRLHRVPATRGNVIDRFGRILVDSRPAFRAVLVREDAGDLETTVENLSQILGQSPAEVHELVEKAKLRPPFHEITVKDDLTWEELVALETHQLDVPGVSVQVNPRRNYPLGAQLAHLLGYVGEVGPADIERDKRYKPGDLIGKTGLERHFEHELRGVDGGEQVEKNNVGRQLRVLRSVPEQPGNTIRLTIDLDLQTAASEALGERDGSIVAIDPRNGEVLAFVNYPSFDPNLFARGIKHDEWRALLADEHHPLTNRGLQGQYPPGSAFKVPVAAAALEEGIVTPFTRIYCPGGYQFGDRYFRCWHRGGHGSMTLHDAIVHSCDVFFYQVAQRLGIESIARYARAFGLGRRSGLPFGSESAGIIPDRQWKWDRFGQPWYAGETLSVAIGQGYVTSTPLQLANMIATMAVGVGMKPHFVMQVEQRDGEVVHRQQPERIRELELRDSTVTLIRQALRDVVGDREGTGKLAAVDGVEVAGKTLTSQVIRMTRLKLDEDGKIPWKHRDHAGFVAYAPVEDPEIAVAVMVEHAEAGGGKTAAPVAGELMSAFFQLKKQRLRVDYAQSGSPTDRPL